MFVFIANLFAFLWTLLLFLRGRNLHFLVISLKIISIFLPTCRFLWLIYSKEGCCAEENMAKINHSLVHCTEPHLSFVSMFAVLGYSCI